MSNSIDKISEDNNSMNFLAFRWIAIFSDGTKIEQFENDIEHNFQEIKDKFSDLAYFNLTDRKGHMFSVDLINGLIGYNYLTLPYIKVKEKKDNIRLIYFRRHQVEITEKMIEKSHTIIYFLGIQWATINNENRNIILQIDENGDFIINGK